MYAAWIFTGLGNPECYNEVNYRGPPIKGAPGKSYTVAIRANAIDSDAVFCKGRARLHVSTELVMHDTVDGPRRHTLQCSGSESSEFTESDVLEPADVADDPLAELV